MTTNICRCIGPRMEVTIRIAIVTLLASALSVAYLPTAIPPGLSQLIGIFGPTFALSLPHVIFILGAAIPSTIVVIVVGLLGGTALLAAATISNGVYVAVFAAWALFCSSLSYGPDAAKTASFGNLLIVSAGLVSLGSWQLVQHGLAITATFPTSNNTSTGDHFLHDALLAIEERICASDAFDCAQRMLDYSPPGREILIPGTSNFSGQTAFVSCENSACTMTIPGGLWLVKGFWKWKGLTNPLAVFRNFLIVLCWALLFVSFGILLPPLRTARKVFAQGVLPKAIEDAVSHIEYYSSSGNSPATSSRSNGEVERNENEEIASEAAATFDTEDSQQRLIKAAIQTVKGGMAPLTAYEPRICCNPLECTWPKLKSLSIGVNQLILFAAASELHQHFRARETEIEKQEFTKYLEILKANAVALSNNDAELHTAFPRDDTRKEFEFGDASDIEQQKLKSFSYFVKTLERMSGDVNSATSTWLDAMHNPKFTGLKDTVTSYILWVLPPLVFLKALLAKLLLPFQPQKWNLRSTLLAAKFAFGVVVLVICEVYWSQYRGFAIGEDTSESKTNGPVTVTLDATPNVYSGWNLLGYVLATTPTVEGTVKKGVLRALGTACGGFLAWIAIIVCSRSYDESATVDLVGLVAWLTITTGIMGYFSLPRDQAAFVGLDSTWGKYGMYAAMTQSLCAIEVALGVGARDVIVANRIVATTSGVLMSIIVALIPPYCRGSDTRPMKHLIQSVENALSEGLQLLKNEENRSGGMVKDDLDRLRASFRDTTQKEKEKVDFLLKDALAITSRFFKVDQRLKELLAEITITAAFLLAWIEFAGKVANDDEIKLQDEGMAKFREEAEKIERNLKRGQKEGSGEKGEDANGKEVVEISSEREEPDLLLDLARFISAKLQYLKDYCEKIESKIE